MLGKFTREQEPDSSLNFPGGDSCPLVVVGKTTGFSSNALKDVIHKRIHDRHSFGAHSSVGVHLLENLVDVDSVGFTPLALPLLISLGDRLLGLTGLLGSLSGNLRGHVDEFTGRERMKNCPNRVLFYNPKTFDVAMSRNYFRDKSGHHRTI